MGQALFRTLDGVLAQLSCLAARLHDDQEGCDGMRPPKILICSQMRSQQFVKTDRGGIYLFTGSSTGTQSFNNSYVGGGSSTDEDQSHTDVLTRGVFTTMNQESVLGCWVV